MPRHSRPLARPPLSGVIGIPAALLTTGIALGTRLAALQLKLEQHTGRQVGAVHRDTACRADIARDQKRTMGATYAPAVPNG
jgi:hypothetical protein